ncbi:YkvA family protein [Humitalea sp. 24SJ18S-53]|uniref:YkvA family protein n=1 Tax=Humitalea sp. 24SJ18S-53 TaxID=3422307 RepID=UPI003D66B1F3
MDKIDPKRFLGTARAAFRRAGEAVAMEAMKAWHLAQDPATPRQTKMILYGALAYFVLPIDAVPDFLPGVGFTDDAAALTAALVATNAAMTEAVMERARASVQKLFG